MLESFQKTEQPMKHENNGDNSSSLFSTWFPIGVEKGSEEETRLDWQHQC